MSYSNLGLGLLNMQGAFNNLTPKPMGPLAMLGVSAGQSLVQGGINALTARGDRRHQLKMWELNNAYNHPSEQMARLRKAGLNPNLMYGQGNVGNSASPPKTPNTEAPKVDALGAILASQDLRMKEAQTDNLREQNNLLVNSKVMQALDLALRGNELKRDNITTEGFQLMSDLAVTTAQDKQLEQSLKTAMTQNEYNVFKSNQELFNQAYIDSKRINSANLSNAEKLGELRALELSMKNSVKDFQNSNQVIDLISKFFSIINKFN